MLSNMNHIADFNELVADVKHATGRARSLNTVFKRIHDHFISAIKGTGMSRACYTVEDDNGKEWVMKVEHNTHTKNPEWVWLADANKDELDSFLDSSAFPNLSSVLIPIHAWFTIGNSLILIVPLMEVIPNINTDEMKNSYNDPRNADPDWRDIYTRAEQDCFNGDTPMTLNGKRMAIMLWLCDDVHDGNIGIFDGLIYLIDYDKKVSNSMDNKKEVEAERMFA